MKITFVAPFGLGQKTTVWARTLPLTRILAEHGHQITLLIPPWDTPGDSGKRWLDADVEVIHVRNQGGMPAIVQRLLREIDAQQPEIVHIVKPRAHAGLVQWLLWQRRKLYAQGLARRPLPRLVLDIDDWEQAWAPINRYPWPLARFLAWQEEWGIRHADAITAASRWLEQRAKQMAPQTPVCYLPNGVDIPQNGVADALQPSGWKILYLTRYVEVKASWLAEFWQALQQRLPLIRLSLAGAPLQPGQDVEFRRRFETIAPQSTGQIDWLGSVDQAAIARLYAEAACAIFPSQNTVLQQAKCSVRLATTLLHGVPVIASAVGEQSNYGAAGAARLIAADASPAHFAAAVAEVIENPSLRQKMIVRARQHLTSRYQWRTLGARLESFYWDDRR
jgi:glycosyltransferase involved in cell wall biosynthesis